MTFWKAARAERDAAAEVAAARRIGFSLRKLDRRLPAFESVSSTGTFTDASVFDGRIYVSTPSALLEYDGSGVRNRWRAGLELPSAPLGRLATGMAGGSHQPELYIATNGAGIVVFDGRGFRQILPGDRDRRKITAILPVGNGRILFGTANRGVLAYDGEHLAPFSDSLGKVQVTALAGDVASVWIGTANHGLYHWNAGTLQHFGEAESLPDARVASLAVAEDRVFAGTPMGIAELRGGHVERTLAPGFFAVALAVRGDTLWAGSAQEGVVQIPLGARKPRPARWDAVTGAGAIAKLFEIEGSLAALSADGLYLDQGGTWREAIGAEPGKLTDTDISALAMDRAGRLWVGYFDRGLDVVDGDRVRHFEDDSVFCVNRIAHNAPAGTTAVATANGLVLFDGGPAKRQVLRRADGLISDHVTDVVLRPDGMLLATPAGITTIDAGGTHSVSDFHGLVNQHVYTIAARGGQVLAGTLGGLSVLRGDIVQASYTTFNSSLRHNWITAIQPVGDEWFVGTYGAGVMRLSKNGEWDAFAAMKGTVVINPNAMLVTPAHVFAGTLEHGLLVYDRASGRWNAVTDGLPSANVTAIEAAGGEIYIGTDNGLVRIAEDRIL